MRHMPDDWMPESMRKWKSKVAAAKVAANAKAGIGPAVMLADAFLSRITEDETGIWELADEAMNQLPHVPEETRLLLAQYGLDLLIDRAFVSMARGQPFAATTVLEASAARTAIADAANWSAPRCDHHITLMLGVTETGRSFYFSGKKLQTTDPE